MSKGKEEGPDHAGVEGHGRTELKSQAVELECLGSNSDAVYYQLCDLKQRINHSVL